MRQELEHVSRMKMHYSQLIGVENYLLQKIREWLQAVVDDHAQFNVIADLVGANLHIKNGASFRQDNEAETTPAERQFAQDAIGAIDFATRNGIGFGFIVATLSHDLEEIFLQGSLDKALALGFLPRCHGYQLLEAKHEKDTSGIQSDKAAKTTQGDGEDLEVNNKNAIAVSHRQQAFSSSLAVDIEAPPSRVKVEVNRIIRDTAKTRELKELYDYYCQVCGLRIEVSPNQYYVEVHHVRPLGGNHKGLDQSRNMLVLCPNHHAMFDLGIPRFLSEAEIEIRGKRFKLKSKHRLSRANINYHNRALTPQKEN